MRKAVLLSVLTFSVFLVYIFAIPSSFAAAKGDVPEEGRAFRSDMLHKIDNAFQTPVQTVEAWVWFPEDMGFMSRGGVMIGSYKDYGGGINFEIFPKGNIRVYKRTEDGEIYDWIFGRINVYTGKWEHIAVVYDEAAGELRGYQNGELKQTLRTAPGEQMISPNSPCAIGGDCRGGNQMYFKGKMKSLAVYADVRSQEEILADAKGAVIDPEDHDLITGYMFEETGNGPEDYDIIPDISKNHHDARFAPAWLKTKEPVGEYAYSFAVVGDTQTLNYYYPDKMDCLYDWLVNNAQEKKIKFVFGLGDITDQNTTEEWARAAKNVAKLDGVIPYSLVRGNHDGHDRYIRAFPYEKYKNTLGGSYDGTMLNTWQTLEVGNIKYLILSLDYGASDSVLNWADEVVKAHEEYCVIVTTHAYFFRDGTTLDIRDMCPPSQTGGFNNGDDIWEKFVSRHPNIVLVLSGHDPSDKIAMGQTNGVNGNLVTQILVDPQGVDAAQGASGMIAMLYFSKDGRRVSVEYYSTVRDMYFMEENQFHMTLDLSGVPGLRTVSGIRLKSAPAKTRYAIGESLALDGAVITVQYTDGSSEDFNVTKDLVSGYDAAEEGTQQITVRYDEFSVDFTVTVYMPVPSAITSPVYAVSGHVVRNVAAGTTVSQLLSGINEARFCKVYMNGKELSGDSPVGTGAEIRILDGTEIKASVKISVRGDINGDGKIDTADLLMVKAELLGIGERESETAVIAADINDDGIISITDFLQVKAAILASGEISGGTGTASVTLAGPSVVRAGETIVVNFRLDGKEIPGLQAKLAFDSSQLTYEGILKQLGDSWMVETVDNKLLAYDNSLKSPAGSGGYLFTVSFTVKDVPAGTKITVRFQDLIASDGIADIDIGSASCTFTVAPPLSSDNSLADLKASNAEIYPAFTAETTEYTAEVPYEVSRLEITALAAHENATVTISAPDLIPNGWTTVTVTVTAEDESIKVYTVKVHRAPDPSTLKSGNNVLRNITVRGFSLLPVFSSHLKEYTVQVPYETENVHLEVIPEDPRATVKIEGADGTLLPGEENIIKIICIAEDGTEREYTVTVKRAASPVSSDTAVPEEDPADANWLKILLFIAAALSVVLGILAAVVFLRKRA